jgi:CrcB protein
MAVGSGDQSERPGTTPVSLLVGCALTAVGAAVGAVARWAITEAVDTPPGHFPWATLVINVVGSALLAGLPLVAAARQRPWIGILVGTGVLGGFTTMSAASVETLALLRGDHVGLAAAYCLGTLGAALLAVVLVDRLTTAAARTAADDAEWNE